MVTVTESVTPYQIRSITYTAESATTPGKTDTVTCSDGGWSCTCEGFYWRGASRPCWHVKAARAGQLGRPRIRIMPLPPAPQPASAARERPAWMDLYLD